MRLVLLVAAVAGLATAAAAQPALEGAPPPEPIPGARPLDPGAAPSAGPRDRHGPHGEHGPRLFVSPSGEPFRSADGLADWFAQADANHDGAITAEEFQADALRAFQSYDANGDGVVDGFEVQAYEQQRVPEITQIALDDGQRPNSGFGGQAGGGRHGGMGGGRRRGMGGGGQDGAAAASHAQPRAGREGAARYSLLNEPEPLLAADTDVDGKVTRQEWLAATSRRFTELDRDRTGRLTLEALRPAAPKR